MAEQALRLVATGPGLKVTFHNGKPSASVRHYWLDYNGARVFRGTIPPGGSNGQATYATHPFVITDTGNNCLAVFVAERGNNHVVTAR